MEKEKTKTRAKLDMRTDRERRRDELHARVCRDFLRLSREADGSCSYYRLAKETARLNGITRQGADRILTVRGLHVRTPRQPKPMT